MSRSPRNPDAKRNWGTDDSHTSILHVDMDAFFASVELISRPELRGREVIVGGRHRGVVLAATYEAREFGVQSAMPMARAHRLCPQAIVIPPTHGLYREYSSRVMAILSQITPVLEQVSVDEAFLDVSGARRRLGSPTAIATRLREQIARELRLPASVGVATNKFVAKLASSHAKPDGMLVIPKDATVAFLHSLPVGALWGVGERTAAKLAAMGTRTVADLAQMPPIALQKAVGQAAGRRLMDLAWGRDPRPVQPVREEKSIGHENTFDENISELAELDAVLLDQAHRCAARLREAQLLAATVSIKLRYADFTTLSRSRTLEVPTDLARTIHQQTRRLLAGVEIPRTGVRLLGIRCEQLHDARVTYVQEALGENSVEERRAEQVMDDVRKRYGVESVTVASLVQSSTTKNTGSGLS